MQHALGRGALQFGLRRLEGGEQIVVNADANRIEAVTPIDRAAGVYLYAARTSDLLAFSQGQAAMYLLRQITGLQLVEIGAAFGNRDHSTVIHSLERVEEMLAEDPGFKERVESLRKRLGSPH